ncbi:uncharacterized protein LOC110860467 isoform X1 [Folsomia candida]|uniref:Uncharacterized protein n=1 Tax=Folsomia candida TaxID=158441 RepID=A0A226D737_FOLCA|nr:uncharacterized protein LOC110860467 isoform X1 [Folsomia candida]OXA40678.1 hypothetical protein Fcan01_24445 [Folsomia candida]
MKFKLTFCNIIGVIFGLGMYHVLPAVSSQVATNELLQNIVETREIGKDNKSSLPRLDHGGSSLKRPENLDVQWILEYANSVMRTGDRAGKQYPWLVECRRDPWHTQVDRFLLIYYILHQYGALGLSGNSLRYEATPTWDADILNRPPEPVYTYMGIPKPVGPDKPIDPYSVPPRDPLGYITYPLIRSK